MLVDEKSRSIAFRAEYAQRSHFCEVFERDMDALYRLAFLLTTNHQDAERCFVASMDEAFQQKAVFKDWTRTWIKRCLIRTAIRIASPTSAQISEKRQLWSAQSATAPDCEIDAITRLAPLERFVFVMSVLERYSAWDCSVLLGVNTAKVAAAQSRSLRHLANPATFFPWAEASSPHSMQVIV
jgi:DNA-directed RNA polymerase specialized sigma24 family protein